MAPKPKLQPKVNWNSIRAETEPWESLTFEQQEQKLDEWDAIANQAFINPEIRRKHEADKKAKAGDTAHIKPEPSEEELNKKLVDYHSKMTQKIAQFVKERNHEKGPDRTKPRARVKNGLKSGRKPGKPLNGHEGPLLSEAEHELAMAARKAPDHDFRKGRRESKRRARERKKLATSNAPMPIPPLAPRRTAAPTTQTLPATTVPKPSMPAASTNLTVVQAEAPSQRPSISGQKPKSMATRIATAEPATATTAIARKVLQQAAPPQRLSSLRAKLGGQAAKPAAAVPKPPIPKPPMPVASPALSVAQAATPSQQPSVSGRKPKSIVERAAKVEPALSRRIIRQAAPPQGLSSLRAKLGGQAVKPAAAVPTAKTPAHPRALQPLKRKLEGEAKETATLRPSKKGKVGGDIPRTSQ